MASAYFVFEQVNLFYLLIPQVLQHPTLTFPNMPQVLDPHFPLSNQSSIYSKETERVGCVRTNESLKAGLTMMIHRKPGESLICLKQPTMSIDSFKLEAFFRGGPKTSPSRTTKCLQSSSHPSTRSQYNISNSLSWEYDISRSTMTSFFVLQAMEALGESQFQVQPMRIIELNCRVQVFAACG
jgi:hypothetical protein